MGLEGGSRRGRQIGYDGNRDGSTVEAPPTGVVGEVGWMMQVVGETTRGQ